MGTQSCAATSAQQMHAGNQQAKCSTQPAESGSHPPGRYQVPSEATSRRWPTTCGDSAEGRERPSWQAGQKGNMPQPVAAAGHAAAAANPALAGAGPQQIHRPPQPRLQHPHRPAGGTGGCQHPVQVEDLIDQPGPPAHPPMQGARDGEHFQIAGNDGLDPVKPRFKRGHPVRQHARNRHRPLRHARIRRLAKDQRPRQVRRRGATHRAALEARQLHLCPAKGKHAKTPRNGRIAKVMRQIPDPN